MKCVSADQAVGDGWGWGWGVPRRGRYRPLSVRHLLLIALVLRLRVSPWSLMHARNNVFTCSHALCMHREEATVLWRTLCPQVLYFLFVCVCVCVRADFAFSHAVKSTRYQTPLRLQGSDGASDNKQYFQCLYTGRWGCWPSDGGWQVSVLLRSCNQIGAQVVSAVKHLVALIYFLTRSAAIVTWVLWMPLAFCLLLRWRWSVAVKVKVPPVVCETPKTQRSPEAGRAQKRKVVHRNSFCLRIFSSPRLQVADWSSQSRAPHWPIHLHDRSITDSLTAVVLVFPQSHSTWSQLAAQELIYFDYVFPCSSTFASIIISPNSADRPDIDQLPALAALVQLVVSERCVCVCVSFFFVLIAVCCNLCVVIVSDNRWCGWSLCCPLPCISTEPAG